MSKSKAVLASLTLKPLANPSPDIPRGTRLGRLPVAKVYPNPDQPRRTLDPGEILRLAADMREQGQLQPIRVMGPDGEGRHQIIAGERRWRAAQKAGIETLDVVVDYDTTDPDVAFDLALRENIERETLSDRDLATALRRVKQRQELTDKQLADRFNKSLSWVRQHLAFGDLAPEAQDLIEAKGLPVALAQTLRGMPAQDQVRLLEQVDGRPGKQTIEHVVLVKELMRGGMDTLTAMRAAEAVGSDAAAVERDSASHRVAGRPRAVTPVIPLFAWEEVSGIRMLRVTYGLLRLNRLLLHRHGPPDDFLEAVAYDLADLRNSCSLYPAGAEIWQKAERLVGVLFQEGEEEKGGL